MSDTATQLVSVVIPTHNRASLLDRAIQSVLDQTFTSYELVIVDDGSTDGTADAVARRADPRLRLVRLARREGAARARNVGIRTARADWVAFLDSDDEWMPEKLQREVSALARAGDPAPAVVYCRLLGVDRTRGAAPRLSARIPAAAVRQALLAGRTPSTSTLMVRRSVLVAEGGFDETLPALQDYELCLRLAEAGHRFALVDDVLVLRHEDDGQRISADPEAQRRAWALVDHKWGPHVRQRLGPIGYLRWRRARYLWIQQAHLRRVEASLARGDRRQAWRAVAALCRLSPWSPRYLLMALATTVRRQPMVRTLARIAGTMVRRVLSRFV